MSKLHADGTYHYASLDDLPEVGRPGRQYKITSTGDIYRWDIDGEQYRPFNPYGLPVTDVKPYVGTSAKVDIALNEEELAELQGVAKEIVDESASMPHGGTGPLAVVWNVHALRGDLWAKGVRDWSYSDMMPPNERWRIQSHTTLQEQRNLYFRYAHKTLWDQVRTHMRHQGEFKKDYVEVLERLGVSVWFENGVYGFKDGEFVVTFE